MAVLWQNEIRSASTLKGNIFTVPWKVCRDAAKGTDISPREAELWACENGICPSRYERSIGTIGLEGQARLLSSHVAVIGCGGLGGWIVEILARAGVGKLAVVDGDMFGDNNLNRQALCTEENIGLSKAVAAGERALALNGAVEVDVWDQFMTGDNANAILEGCDVVMDALDSNRARSVLVSACRELDIPLIHGAIGGFWGQSCVIMPDDRAPWEMTGGSDKGIEETTGNPPFTPVFIASIQAAEAIRLITGIGEPLRDLLWCDLKEHEYLKVKISVS